MNMNKRGYTFVELLGVILIIILVITPLIGFLTNLFDRSLENHTISQMNVIASSVLDRAKVDAKQDYLENQNIESRSTYPEYISLNEYTRYSIPNEFYATLNIEIKDQSLKLCSVEVIVYSDILGPDRGVVLETLVYYDE